MDLATPSAIVGPDDLAVNLPSFLRSLRAESKSPRTIEAYREAVVLFENFARDRGMPTDVRDIKREHIEDWIIDLQGRWTPATGAPRW